MNFIVNESKQKLRGGYYTPSDIASFITDWVSEINPQQILEPSCGDGVFIEEINNSVKHNNYTPELFAIEYDFEEYNKSLNLSENCLSIDVHVENADYLTWALENITRESIFDAVVGNPPFIRYQYLPDHMQEKAANIFNFLNVKFTKHTNAWVPFILSSIKLLKPGGRIGMVLPSEILHVTYAQSLRSYIGEQCRYTMVFDPEDLWFENTLQGAIILLLEKKKSKIEKSLGLGIKRTSGRDFLSKKASDHFKDILFRNGDTVKGKWTYALLSNSEFALLQKLKKNPNVYKFDEIAKVDVGIVTGANKFFLVQDKVVDQYDLKSFSYPMFGRSAHCPGVIYDESQHKTNSENSIPNNFLFFDIEDDTKLNKKQKEYIAIGEKQELYKRYKCRIRKPWYKVPSIYGTEIGLLKRCHDFPRLIQNKINAYTTDTAYRIKLLDDSYSSTDFVFSFINSLTALFAELEGRHYGGGVLEVVPSEIEKLYIPMIKTDDHKLKELDHNVKNKKYNEILPLQDNLILGEIGISTSEIKTLQNAWLKLRNRRQRK